MAKQLDMSNAVIIKDSQGNWALEYFANVTADEYPDMPAKAVRKILTLDGDQQADLDALMAAATADGESEEGI